MCLNKNRRKNPLRNHSAFTLVELLVVIGIIALLIAILLPALKNARDKAVRIKDMAQMRSLGQMVFIYAANNKGHLPVGAMGITGSGTTANLNEEFITEEMYKALGFPELMTVTGSPPYSNPIWNGTPLPAVWICPANPYPIDSITTTGVYNPIIQWGALGTVSAYSAGISTSYIYAGVGVYLPGLENGTNTSNVNPSGTPDSYVRDINTLALTLSQGGFSSSANKVLFADKVLWHYQLGFIANHGVSRYQGNPVTPGENVVYADGHGAWVDLSHSILLNGGQATGPTNAASHPVIMAPPPHTPLPNNEVYPAVIHDVTQLSGYGGYECWYWQ